MIGSYLPPVVGTNHSPAQFEQMLKGLLFGAVLSIMAAPVVACVCEAEHTTIEHVGGAAAIVSVVALVSRPGTLGLNSYQFNFLLSPTTAPAIGDAAALEKLCRQIGYLIGAGQATIDWEVRAGITTGAFVADTAAGAPLATMRVDTPFRLPSSLEPAFPDGTNTGNYICTASINTVTTATDDACGTILSNLDKPVVTKGCLIVAYLPAGVDVSDEMETQINLPMADGQRMVIGKATQDALDGIYTPFTSAWAYASIGGPGLSPVAVVAVRGNKKPNRQ